MKQKIIALLLVVVLGTGMTGCSMSGEEAGTVDDTYTVTYDNTLPDEDLDAIPDYQFFPLDMKNMVVYGMSISVELDLDEDGTYQLTAKDYNVDTSVKEGEEGYFNVRMQAKGSYEKDGDAVTIKKPDSADYVYECGSLIAEQEMFKGLSYAADGTNGEWNSTDTPELLQCIPETVFAINEDGEITSWEKTK